MKIAIVSHLYPSESGFKHGVFIRNHAEMLEEFAEVKVWVPTPRYPPFARKSKFASSPLLQPPQANRWRFWSLPRHTLARLVAKQYQHLAAEILSWQADLVHIHWAFPDAQLVSRLKDSGIPTVVQVHGSDWYRTGHVAGLRNEQLLAASAIIAVGMQLKEDMARALPRISDNIHHIPNWVDAGRFTIPADKNRAKNQMGWDVQRTQLLCVANFKSEKGVDDLVESIRHLQHRSIDLHLIGTDFRDTFSADLHRKADSIEHSRVIFHPPVPYEELVGFYQAADLFVLPSRSEGFGIGLIEAGACGVPLVATRSGGPEEIVESEVGMLADKSNPENLAEILGEILDSIDSFDPEKVRNRIVSRFGKTRAAEQFHQLYQNLIS